MFPQPENIVVEQVSSQPVVKLTDFGDAVQLNPPSTYIHPLLGSPEFSAPELVLGQPASLMSDIWSLGLFSIKKHEKQLRAELIAWLFFVALTGKNGAIHKTRAVGESPH